LEQEKDQSTLEGVVESIIFKNEESGYTVARIITGNGMQETIMGSIPFLGVGENISAVGDFIEHPKYGRQFSVKSYTREMPTDEDGIYEYLASRAVKGIGSKTAKAIVDKFGRRTFHILSNQPERLAEIRGVSPEKAREIGERFMSLNVMRMLVEYLNNYSLPAYLAAPLLRTYGVTVLEQLNENPYLLCEDEFGVNFYEVDKIAQDLGLPQDSEVRLDAALLYELSYNLQNGHAFIPEEKLIAISAQLAGVEDDLIFDRLEELEMRQRVVRDTLGGLDVCYLWHIYRCETFVAQEVARMKEMYLLPPPNLRKQLAKAAEKASIDYDEKQQEAICLPFSAGISLITGGPGTGKTTALLTMLDLLEENGMTVQLAAPTSRAAKRMSEVSHREARTIHRMLETGIDERTGKLVFKRNKNNPLDCDVVIIDESSMIDLTLASSVLDALKLHARLVLIGDADQLPPIGPGSFFADLLACDGIPQVRLEHIFRQALDSDIIESARRINVGDMPDLYSNNNDFYFTTTPSAESAAQSVVSLVSRRIPARFGIEPGEIQVICPSRQQAVGTANLNRLLQAALNPPADDKPEIAMGPVIFRLGDRVMQIRNNYDALWRKPETAEVGTGVFNGDIGEIVYLDRQNRVLVCLFDDREVEYGFDELNQLEHAWACTAHKSQGSEYKAVVIPVYSAPERLLNRSLLYTAVTRAKQLLILVGRADTVELMVSSNKKTRRYSALRTRLRALL